MKNTVYNFAMKNITGIILAGGKSSRYGLKKQKFLVEYQGKPIIVRIVEAIKPVVDEIIVVTGPENSEIKQVLSHFNNIKYAIQKEPLGTGHALLCVENCFKEMDKTLLVTFADKPLVTTETFKKLIEFHIKNRADITIATAILPNPGSKGRIIRKNGKFERVVEARDADESILNIKEVNAGFIVCQSGSIFNQLRKIKNENAAGEYYLTDVYAEFVKDGMRIQTVEIPAEESCDINTVEELKRIEQWIHSVKEQSM